MPVINDLIFLRHSLPLIDPMVPAHLWHLSEEGKRRCKLLAAQLNYFLPRKIVSSLEPKALETAQIAAEVVELSYESAEGLHEHVRSHIEYASQDIFETQVKMFFEQPDRLVFGDETADQAHTRFLEAVKNIQERYPDQTPLVIVSHGTVISLFVSRAWGIDPFSFWKSLKLPCIVEFSTQKPNIISPEPPPPLSPIPVLSVP